MISKLRYLRLRGRLGESGPPFLAELAPGVHRLGSIADNDIVVSSHGVSRHHLLLRVGDQVTLEDLGSKNGTRVNGLARKHATLEVGDELFVGPVRLKLEAIEADDVRLAATGDAKRRLLEIGDLELDSREVGDAELEATDRLLNFLDDSETLGGQRALEHAAAEAGAGGACWLMWRARQACRVTASCGVDFHGLLDLEELCQRAEALAGSQRAVVLHNSGPPRLSAAVLLARPHPAALLLWDVDTSAAFTRILARLLDRESAALEVVEASSTTTLSPEAVHWIHGPGPASRLVGIEVADAIEQPLPLLITGEKGSGKKHLARWIHAADSRPGPLVITGCAELTDAALAQGFRIAAEEKGTLLLEEIAELDSSLYEAVWQLVGAREANPRLIVTNRDREELGLPQELERALRKKVIALEPLRQRRDEIPRLIRHFLATIKSKPGPPVRGLTIEAMRRLMRYDWPGNIEQLKSTLETLLSRAPAGQIIDSASLPEEFEPASELADPGKTSSIYSAT